MSLMTREEYLESLSRLNPRVYMFGERIDNVGEHPFLRPSINSIAETYKAVHDPEVKEFARARSHLTDNEINRFTNVPHSREDMMKWIKLERELGRRTGACWARCVGKDALSALAITVHNIDEEYGTNYEDRFNKYLNYVQEKDLVCAGAMTDVKGDRSRKPHEQKDPDMYMRVVEEKNNGVIVKGAKAHITGGAAAHEVIIMPTRALTKEEKKYAISFAVPIETDGITLVVGRQPNDKRRFEEGDVDTGNLRYGSHETVIIFDRVFVPEERIFMNGEYEFAMDLVDKFACYHRRNYGACRGGVAEVLIGAAATIAEYNGVPDAPHIRDKITEMIHLKNTLYSCSVACSVECERTSSGAYLPNRQLANSGKLNAARFLHQIARLVQDIAGGLTVTLPSEEDCKNPWLKDKLNKYLRANPAVSTEDRAHIFRLIENMTLGTLLVESLHGAGSPEALKLVIRAMEDLDEKKELAQRLAGVRRKGG